MSYDTVKALLSKGVSRPSLYEVIVDFGFGARESISQLQFLCKKASVPPVSVNTIVVAGHESMGVVREQATSIAFTSPFSITVISDRDYTVYKDMKRWFDRVARGANPNRLGGFIGQSQRINYYNTYTTTITLVKLELDGGGQTESQANRYTEPFRVNFNRCFPVNIGELTLGSDLTDAAMEFNVDFAYETYSFETDQSAAR